MSSALPGRSSRGRRPPSGLEPDVLRGQAGGAICRSGLGLVAATVAARGARNQEEAALLDALWLIGGLALLYFGAEYFVASAAGFARSIGISTLVVGLTVVAYGTSAPEAVVGIQAALTGYPDIVMGNVVGSNIANIALILGGAAIISPPRVDGALPRREVPLLLATVVALPVVLFDGVIAGWEGALLVAAAVAYTVWMVRSSRGDVAEARRDAAGTEEAAEAAVTIEAAPGELSGSRLRLSGLIALSLGALVLGGYGFVEGATGIARAFGMSERLVGLTIVAIGTSLPELATSFVAARRGQADIAVGNVIGSNIFNILFCLGIAVVIAPIEMTLESAAVDLAVLAAITLLAAVMMRAARTITRWEGALLVVFYGGYLTALALGA